MELRKRRVRPQDLLSSEGLLVRVWMKGERGAVSAMEAGARAIR